MDRFGFLKVAAAIPHLRVGDCDYNAGRMTALAEEAAQRGAEIVVFPELSLTGYTCGDLLLQPTLLDAADEALEELVRATRKLPLTLIAGAPLRHGETLYNCAVVFTQGRILGAVPKSYIPGYAEFYEPRWFASGAGISGEQIAVAGQETDFGTDLTFAVNGAEFGIELCEDLWAAVPPSSHLAQNGAKVIFNLSASPEGGRQARLPAAARHRTVGADPLGLCLLLGRLRGVFDRPGLRRECPDRRKRAAAARRTPLLDRRAGRRRRRGPRTTGLRTPPQHLLPDVRNGFGEYRHRDGASRGAAHGTPRPLDRPRAVRAPRRIAACGALRRGLPDPVHGLA